MNKKILISKLSRNHLRTSNNRELLIESFIEYPKDIKTLIELIVSSDDHQAFLATWVLDGVARKNIHVIKPYISQLITILEEKDFDGVVRSTTKIFELIANDYKKHKVSYSKYINKKQKERLVELGFEMLLSNHKVAVKVFMMDVILEFGKEIDWAHLELKTILEREIYDESPSYQSRGKKTLKAINKFALGNI